jgi:hypothetical protein
MPEWYRRDGTATWLSKDKEAEVSIKASLKSEASILDARPIYHQTDEAIRGHVFCSFLALVLRKALEDRLAATHLKPEWGALIRQLDRLPEIETELRPCLGNCAAALKFIARQSGWERRLTLIRAGEVAAWW